VNSAEWTGGAPSLDEAVGRGLRRLGLEREQVRVEVLEEKSSGLLSMMDFRRVKVRLTASSRDGARPVHSREFTPSPPADAP
jgi:predicted RNA-binding protein Jag